MTGAGSATPSARPQAAEPGAGPKERLLGLLARWAPAASQVATGLGILLAIGYWWLLTSSGGNPGDVRAYWSADPNALYPTGDDWRVTGYVYSPAFELVAGIGRTIPLDIFVAIWRALLLVVLVYLAGPFTAPLLITVPVASEINGGNVQLLLALAIVLSFRWPATWAFVILTKLTPGIGLLWFVLRREWRHVAIALGVTALIVAATTVIWPDRWAGYIHLLTGYSSPAPYPWYLPFWVRLPWAVAIIVIGAWRGWRWTVVVGATLALPIFWTISPSMLVGVLPFARAAGGRWLSRYGDRRRAGGDRRHSVGDRRAASDDESPVPELLPRQPVGESDAILGS
jgi:hypothetical protein